MLLWFRTGYTAGRFYVCAVCTRLLYYCVYLRQNADVPLSPAATLSVRRVYDNVGTNIVAYRTRSVLIFLIKTF